jgi:hypothetical protein
MVTVEVSNKYYDLQQNWGSVAHDLKQKFIAIATDLRQRSCIFCPWIKTNAMFKRKILSKLEAWKNKSMELCKPRHNSILILINLI